MDETIRVLADRQAIERLIIRYAYAVDNKDLDAVVESFAPDARLSLDGGAMTAEGITDIHALYAKSFEHGLVEGTAHSMTNLLIEVSGDSASANTFLVAYLPRGENLVVRGIRYADTCSRRDGEWKFSERNHVTLWQFTVKRDACASLLNLTSAVTKPS